MRWLELPGIRLVHVDGEWTCPVDGAESHRQLLADMAASRESLAPFDTPGVPRTLAQPAR